MPDAVEPLFSYPPIGPRVTVDEAARLLQEPGVELPYLTSQLRGFVQRRLIEVREKRGNGRTAANLFELDDVCAAKVLSIVIEAGVSDAEMLQATRNGLYSWRDNQRPKYYREKGYHSRHPISAALSGFSRGDLWSFRIDVMRNNQSGERHIEAFAYSPQQEEFASDAEAGFEPRSTLVIPLYTFMPRILRMPNQGN